jgi:hypothetical protein
VRAIAGEDCGERVGDEFITFDVFIKFAITVDETKGVTHFMEDGGKEIVFTIGWAVGICNIIG